MRRRRLPPGEPGGCGGAGREGVRGMLRKELRPPVRGPRRGRLSPECGRSRLQMGRAWGRPGRDLREAPSGFLAPSRPPGAPPPPAFPWPRGGEPGPGAGSRSRSERAARRHRYRRQSPPGGGKATSVTRLLPCVLVHTLAMPASHPPDGSMTLGICKLKCGIVCFIRNGLRLQTWYVQAVRVSVRGSAVCVSFALPMSCVRFGFSSGCCRIKGIEASQQLGRICKA